MVLCAYNYFLTKDGGKHNFQKHITIKVVNKKHDVIYCLPGYIEVGNTHIFQKGKLSWGRAGIQTRF